jgi:putative transposase
MRQNQIRCKVARKWRVRTTDSNHAHPVAANVLNRKFAADKPDAVWLCDITYIPTGEGFLYLAGVMDLCSRRIVGWSMAEHLRAELALDGRRQTREGRRVITGSSTTLDNTSGTAWT